MLGTIQPVGEIQTRLEAVREALVARRSISVSARRILKARFASYRSRNGATLAQLIRGLERCNQLSKSFRAVERDKSVTRTVELKDSWDRVTGGVSIPLVFGCKLPAPRIYSESVTRDRDSYSIKSIVPHPTPEALNAIREHKPLFDWVEVWWVPNDVLVEKIPNPDPIVVGAVQIPKDRVYYFELHRWIDETVEVGWWSKEGY